MPEFSFLLLYVENPSNCARFYADLLGAPIVEESPTFAMLPLREGVMLGLWSRRTVEPVPAAVPGASEIAFTVADADAVAAVHDEWTKRGITILQPPTRMDFGHTFVARDPDGHRLRVLVPDAG
jgi:predicted enzyme related to lactoylglutathione lyase